MWSWTLSEEDLQHPTRRRSPMVICVVPISYEQMPLWLHKIKASSATHKLATWRDATAKRFAVPIFFLFYFWFVFNRKPVGIQACGEVRFGNTVDIKIYKATKLKDVFRATQLWVWWTWSGRKTADSRKNLQTRQRTQLKIPEIENKEKETLHLPSVLLQSKMSGMRWIN